MLRRSLRHLGGGALRDCAHLASTRSGKWHVFETLDRHSDATKVAEAMSKAGLPPKPAELSITEQRALAWEMFFDHPSSDDAKPQYEVAETITPGVALDAVAFCFGGV